MKEDIVEDWLMDSDEIQFIDQCVREGLSQDFFVRIPENFADDVCEKIEERSSLKETLLKMGLILGGLLLILAASLGSLYYSDSAWIYTIQDFFLNYKIPLIFGLFCFIGIQAADVFLLNKTKQLAGK